MRLYKALLTHNDCYSGPDIRPRGVMVHSTGANNPWLRRYVAPDDGLLGAPVPATGTRAAWGPASTPLSDNWRTGAWPPTRPCPGPCGAGTRAVAGNDTHISFEICEDGLTDEGYFQAVYREAVELTAHLCRRFRLDPWPTGW
ncbi:MAG: N-acetylmuramoyl-L-alanine amidase [Lawsonibacter sp.]